MISIKTFVFNPFQVNTYLLFDESGECIVIDAGNYLPEEHQQLHRFFREKLLRPVRLINTHGHIDHIFGNSWFLKEYGLKTEIHPSDEPLLKGAKEYGKIFDIDLDTPPPVSNYLHEGDRIGFGNSSVTCIHVPGHSPGSLVFYSDEQAFAIVGDVLFQGNIGRTDLPGGDYTTLINGISEKLLTLDDSVMVYPGHGSQTTVGNEKRYNPFFS
jgi:hydroxyacylglutathione hydrolase